MTMSLTVHWWLPTAWLVIGAVIYIPANYLIWTHQIRLGGISAERLEEAHLHTFGQAMIHRVGWRRAAATMVLRIIFWPPLLIEGLRR